MFDSSLISLLRSDTALAALVSSYKSHAAIFSDGAPQDAALPFAETRILESSVGDSIVASFTVIIDFYQQSESAAKARAFCQRIIEVLDRAQITGDARYHCIRIFILSGPEYIDEGDPRDIHYRVQFSARAGRKKYIETISTTEGE